MKFAGVAMTDDLDMTGVSTGFERREAVIRAIGAGNDLLMIRNEVRKWSDVVKKANIRPD